MLEATLNKMAENILSFDEASLSSLWEKYKNRMEHFDTSREWEKAVIIFFIINSVRVKNHIFNEHVLNLHERKPGSDSKTMPRRTRGNPDLKLVK